ncbi:tyrosine recombinase XerC, partial [Chloroflexota bacterium]
LAELTNFTKSYISQVKNEKKQPSKRLLDRLIGYQRQRVATERNYLPMFLQSRKASDCSRETLRFYKVKLCKFLSEVNADKARQQDIERFLLQFNTPGNRHAYFRAIRTLYKWREQIFDLSNPMKHMKAPKMGKLILPSLNQDHVLTLIQEVHNIRDKAIIALFTESGLRLSELANISPNDIDWDAHTIQVGR